MLIFTVVFCIFVLGLLGVCGHFGKAGVWSVIFGITLVTAGLRLYEEVLQLDCESSLPRDQSCVIVSLTPSQSEAVYKLLEEAK